MNNCHFLFLNAATREAGIVGNTETLARRAAEQLPADCAQTWLRLADCPLPPFVDLRHSVGVYPMPEGPARRLLDATLAATDIVLVSPVYWYSVPASLKLYFDHWSAWMRVPGLDFKARMASKRLWVVATSGDRAKAEPMFESYRLCAGFMSMPFAGVLWGKGGAPGAVHADAKAIEEANHFFADAARE
jgi:putative NADPH-quinone reductase